MGKFCSCISEYHKCSDEEGQSSKKESSHMNSGACKKPSCAVFPQPENLGPPAIASCRDKITNLEKCGKTRAAVPVQAPHYGKDC